MKKVILVFALFFSSGAHAQLLNYCEELIEGEFPEFCGRMKYMRATINVLDQQRDMGLVNYRYIELMGGVLNDSSKELLQILPSELASHRQAIRKIGELGEEVSILAKKKDSDVFRLTNSVRSQCLNCHTSNANNKGGSWPEVFKYDWERITKACNTSGRNPYLCKSMNGMATSYGHLLTAYTSKFQNYEVTEGVATEIVRILKDLKNNNFLHMAEEFRNKAQVSAEEVVALAHEQNPAVFEKTFYITKSCNECHSSNHFSDTKRIPYKVW